MQIIKRKSSLFLRAGFMVLVFIVSMYGMQPRGQGTIVGKVSIGPLCPVEPCSSPQPEIYTSRKSYPIPFFLLILGIYLRLKLN